MPAPAAESTASLPEEPGSAADATSGVENEALGPDRTSGLALPSDDLPAIVVEREPASETQVPEAAPAVWAAYRDLHGFEVRSLTWRVTVHERGVRDVEVEVRGVRPLTGDLRDPDMRTALMQAVCQGSMAMVREVSAVDGDLRTVGSAGS